MYIPHSKEITLVPTMADAPPASLPYIPKKLADRLGGTVGEMFPELAKDFPKTTASMEKHWSRPKLAVMWFPKNWMPNLYLEQEALNLFFCGGFFSSIYEELPEALDAFSHLPPRWISLYLSMSSFVITPKSTFSPMGWQNTPLPQPMGTDTFSTETNTKKSKLKAFAQQLGVDPITLNCYLLTDGHDSLWVVQDFKNPRLNGKVFHVHADAFEKAQELPDPEGTLDEYLAHVVAGGNPAEFDFRQGC